MFLVQCLFKTALHYVAKSNDMALVRLLAGTYKADVEARNHVSRLFYF